MKYLEHMGLESVSNLLSAAEFSGGLLLHGRVEIYSTKKTGDDKKHSKLLESKLASNDQHPDHVFRIPSVLPPPQTSPEVTTGKSTPESEAKKTRKLLVDLIQTLNAAQLDHDFSELSPDSFAVVPLQDAMNAINAFLAEMTVQRPLFMSQLWKEINHALSEQLNQCEVYVLTDSTYLDDLEDGILSSFHYFFCHKELRRMCYFTCHTTSKFREISNNYDSEMEDELDQSMRRSDDEEMEEEEDEDYGWN